MYQPGWRDRTQEVKGYETSLRRAQLVKVSLPILVVVLIVATFLWPKVTAWRAEQSQDKHEFALAQDPNLKNKLFKPVYESLDGKGKPVFLQADLATKINPVIVDFDHPSGKIYLENGKWVKFWSETGKHHKENDTLDLKGNVRMVTEDGYDIITPSARIFLSENRGMGDEHVHGKGPSGEIIEADGFRLAKSSKTITFTGNTQVSFESGG